MARNELLYKGKTYQRFKSGNIHLATSLSFSQLEANTMSVVVESEDTTLTDFERNEPIIYKHRGRQVGIFYVQNVTRIAENQYKFEANSAVGLLIDNEHNGGIYDGQNVEDVVKDVCGPIPYAMQHSLYGKKVYGWLPIASARDNLSQVLFPIGATVKADLDGVLHIETFWDGFSNYQGRICKGTNVAYDKKVTSVIVTEHTYNPGAEEEELFAGTATDGERVKFFEPMHSLVAEGFTVKESGANYAILSAGTGTLRGKTYIHNTREVIREVSKANTPNIKRLPEESTLVSLVNANAIADRMAAFYRCVETINAPAYWHWELPGDRINVIHPYGGNPVVDAVVKSADITMSNVLKAQETMMSGLVLPHDSGGDYYDFREVLTSDGYFTAPAGVTKMTAVLIGGGQGGTKGHDGEDTPEAPKPKEETHRQEGRTYYLKGWEVTDCVSGKGGAPGSPGLGGKFLKVDIDVTEGERLQVRIGRGGAGATEDGTEGQYGTDTLFGGFSSSSGTATADGYYDTITKETFAGNGMEGIAGGNGVGYENGEIVFPPPIKVDGVDYVHGSQGNKAEKTTVVAGVTLDGEASGGLGGGPAYGGNGKDGRDGAVELNRVSVSASVTTGTPGDGADAAPPPKPAVYGQGGTSGNGGGGAGSIAIPIFSRTIVRDSTGDQPGKLYAQATIGKGGLGSPGSEGADGCVILYYRKPAAGTKSGALMDSQKRFVLDATGRLIVV